MVALNILSFLAIDLLGKSLADVDEFVRDFSIPGLSAQHSDGTSALLLISSLTLTWSVIKLYILARDGTDFSHLYLIDFRFAKRRLSRISGEVNLVKEHINIVGTLY